MWGLATGRRLVIKYQEPLEANPERLVTRYHRIPVIYSVYKNFKKGDRLEHYNLSFVFFRNDESLGFSWDIRWAVSLLALAFFLSGLLLRMAPTDPVWLVNPVWEAHSVWKILRVILKGRGARSTLNLDL